MSHSKKKAESKVVEKDVLYQKIGSQWYVFSFDGDQLQFSALPVGKSPKASNLELYERLRSKAQKAA